MPDIRQTPSNVPSARLTGAGGEGDIFPSGLDQSPGPLIEVPAKRESRTETVKAVSKPQRVDVLKPEPVQKAERPIPADDQKSGEESLEWRRKAQGRRLKALRTEEEEALHHSEDYVPAFTARRIPDSAPEFDQLPDAPLAAAVKPYTIHPGWSISLLIAGGLLALVLTGGTANLLRQSGQAELERKMSGTAAALPGAVQRDNAEMVPEARRVMQRFFEARTPEEKAQFVRGGLALLPVLRNYYATHPDEIGPVNLASNVEFETEGGRDFVLISGSANTIPFDTFVERTSEGPRIDWRFLTGAGDMEWNRWVKERPRHPVSQRVIVGLDDYYAAPFDDPREWVCVKMTDITLSSTVWGYAKRLSDTGLSILHKLNGNLRCIRLYGSFEFPAIPKGGPAANPDAPQVIIHSVSNKGWLDRSPEVTGGDSTPSPETGAVPSDP